MNQGEGPIRWLLVLAALVCSVQSASAVAVLTPRDTLARTGTNTDERVLTPAAVGGGRFGKLWTLYADGQVVAQPCTCPGSLVGHHEWAVQRRPWLARPGKRPQDGGATTLKNGEAAVLHEFVAIVNCELAPGTIAGKQFNPYMDSLGGPPRTIYRIWDPIEGNYALGARPRASIAASRCSAEAAGVVPNGGMQ